MLISLAIIILSAMTLSKIFDKLNIPGLLGMLITGVILGPYALNLINPAILNISPDLRRIALVIILARAGLSLNINDLKKVGHSAILMCFVPACFEILGFVLVAPKFLHISFLEAAIVGSVIAAVSPAVVVPRMINLIENGYGVKKGIPQLIMAGSSVDDVFVIVLFTAFTGLAKGEGVSASSFLQIPISITLGIAGGIIVGFLLLKYFEKFHIRDSGKILILLSISFLLLGIEDNSPVPFSGLLAIMTSGIIMLKLNEPLSKRISTKLSKLWVCAEIFLFVLVGATVDINYAINAGMGVIIVIFIGLLFRTVGVFVCLIKSKLNIRERVFCTIAYLPKATVQAAIGGVPLAMGLACGQTVLTTAIIAILVTAPLGALGVDLLYKKLL